ncbi:unnamed protein product [Rotaria sp. Silwood1]|nr:unnamed protein product [Rotaria sp. Silwood1]CAF4749431.1 unnamed protein product [Rotaria sp. Silwood1]
MPRLDQCTTVDEVWEKLFNGIEYLFQFQTIRYSKWMLLYTYIFDYCTNNLSHNAELYEKLKNYLRNYLEDLCQSSTNLLDRDLLEFYMNQWKKYCVSCKILHGIFSYFNRHYIRRELDFGNPDISEIYSMAMKIWHQILSQLFYTKITRYCLNLIKAERNHQKIDTEIISNVIQTYVISHINQHKSTSDNNSQILDSYQEYFENQFFQDTQEFYRLQTITYLQHHSVIDYLLKIPEYFNEEIRRITAYLHPSSIKNLEKKLDEVLIHDQLTVIHAEAKKLIHDEKIQELNLLYRTVNRIENGTSELKNMMENYIYKIGIETIECINSISINACRKFINNNAVIQAIGNTTNMAEYLARYCDKFLRKRKEETDLEIIINQIKILLYYMQEKDVFQKYYSKLFAKRLINQMSISNDYEQMMISNIEITCGFGFAYKMKQMCQDIETSKNILNQYHQYCETEQFTSKINFSIMILKTNVWLFSTPSNIILPNKLEHIVNNFNKFYKYLHNGRKLTWIYQHSKGELQTFFTDRVYTLQVSMYQMVILLLFNNALEWTIEKIQDETQIKIELLLLVLNTLIESKILTCTQFLDRDNLDINCIIKLSNDFRSDKYRINLNTTMKSVEEGDVKNFHNTIDQDRIMSIRATIVRIMKLNKTMNENLLIDTVIQQLNSHFNSNVSTIKDCINVLITKEYLERQSNDKDLLCYRA